jgi:[CysO sulfur-carrier protein]-S-L-cysteine hydrolase
VGAEDRLVSETVYGAALLARIAALCEADPEREVCGFVVRRGDALEVEPVPNLADRYHARDPEGFPRTSRDGYLMDPRVQLRLHEQLEAEGGAIVAVYHSHVEVGAYFSAKDRADAVVDGIPVLPGAEYLVFGLKAGRVSEKKRFVLLGGEFVERPLA